MRSLRGGVALLRPAGLSAALAAIAIAAPGAGAADWSAAQALTVVASEYHFAPDGLALQRGVAYRLHLENHGKETHEFTAPEFFKAAKLRNPGALNADRTELVVHPGEAKDLYLVPRRAGRYGLRCADHDWAGMTGEITVR